jgi:hypothetical protein
MPPNSYKAVLVRFMSYRDSTTYAHNKEFTQEELALITPAEILCWLNVQTYGAPEPDANDNPTMARSNSIKFWKKALSASMPNRMMQWNEVAQTGNPTRSVAVNDLIKRVKKKEVRRQGAPSQARWSTQREEYESMQAILRDEGQNIMSKYGIPAMNNFQFHMIARIDDTTQFKVENLQSHQQFDFCLKAKLNWSKNVHEERDAPWQVLVGAMDVTFCVIVSLAVWLEIYIMSDPNGILTPYVYAFSDDNNVPSGGIKSKQTVQTVFARDIFPRPQFVNQGGPLGSHSVRKMGSTEARRRGATKDEKDIRGRWKGKGRVSDVYDDIELPYPDAKVAGLLCIGGPCKYVVKDDSGITSKFLLQHVVPGITRKFPRHVALVLGTALLWRIFSQDGEDAVPQAIRQRVIVAYRNVQHLDEGINPISKIPLVITGNEGEVYMDPIVEDDGAADSGHGDSNNDGEGGGRHGGGGAGGAAFANRPNRQQLLALHSQMIQLREKMNTLQNTLEEDRVTRNRQYNTMNTNIRRMALRPAQHVRNTENANDAQDPAAVGQDNRNPAATLSPTPRTLYVLWEEYQHGVGGRKAARFFTPQERGQVKFKYSRRKVFWDVVSHLIRSGLHSNVAIDRIYEVYGQNATVTTVINQMRRDKRNGNLHPLLH